jgi:NAD(P)-dependent dehydrogenase (short-subunit alcohol dehydrogenase family)
MSTAIELLRRADEICSRIWDPKAEELSENIRTFLAAEPEAEPVAWIDITDEELEDMHEEDQFGLFCDADEFVDIARAVIAKFKYRNLHPPRPEPARKPLPEKIDPILRTAGSMKYHPSYVAGWNNCIDAMSNGAEARKPMTDEEIEKGMDVNALSHFEACAFASGVRFAEKHHEIGRGME